jgi:hypothetical protein
LCSGAFAHLAPCATVHVRAEYSSQTDGTPFGPKHRRMSSDPLSFQVRQLAHRLAYNYLTTVNRKEGMEHIGRRGGR